MHKKKHNQFYRDATDPFTPLHKYGDFINKRENRDQRRKRRKQEIEEYEKHQKRLKFRDLAHFFLEYTGRKKD